MKELHEIPDPHAEDMINAMYDERHAYHHLATVLVEAYNQAALGKGKERHANGRSFDAQPMQTICELLGSSEGMAFQVVKKVQESLRMEPGAAQRELLGAIVYSAGMIVSSQKNQHEVTVPAADRPTELHDAILEANCLLCKVGIDISEIAMGMDSYSALKEELRVPPGEMMDMVDGARIAIKDAKTWNCFQALHGRPGEDHQADAIKPISEAEQRDSELIDQLRQDKQRYQKMCSDLINARGDFRRQIYRFIGNLDDTTWARIYVVRAALKKLLDEDMNRVKKITDPSNEIRL